ncbi:hypothetical protein LAZ67_14002800 [Cordylochernes scorpioides]|uniref:Copia protein n=1 Tax=Cordylochernes scorpioides TaxID=51811 RepID=A0ABY6L750_9ARAC|nr:hypothetical protein LAZ67_14002800 [Cordylochernes scorpioides]
MKMERTRIKEGLVAKKRLNRSCSVRGQSSVGRPDLCRHFREKMTTELPQIQKFNGDNFHLWKFQMKIILETKDLLSIIDGSEVKPEIEDIAKFSEWKKKDAKSKMLITTALEFKYLQQIVNCQTSAEMWKKLSTIYELKSETNKYLLQQRFFEYKMNPNDNIASHISKVETRAQQMKDLGEPISDVALITKVICSLPENTRIS